MLSLSLCQYVLTTAGLLIDSNYNAGQYVIVKVKVKEAYLCSAFIEEPPYTQGAQVRITQCYRQTTPYLAASTS